MAAEQKASCCCASSLQDKYCFVPVLFVEDVIATPIQALLSPQVYILPPNSRLSTENCSDLPTSELLKLRCISAPSRQPLARRPAI
jgi:hypothetical protein